MGRFLVHMNDGRERYPGAACPLKNFRVCAKYALISRLVLSLKNSGLAVTRASTIRTLSLRTRQWAADIILGFHESYSFLGCIKNLYGLYELLP